VDTATSANEALSKLGLIPGGVDAVIIDMGLPDRRGDVLVREIRASHPSLPVVIASGGDNADVSNSFRNTPFIAFVRKPYTSVELCRALRRFGIRC